MSTTRPNFFQIYLSDTDSEAPLALRGFQSDCQRLFSHCDYHFFNKDTLRLFIAEKFGGDILTAYDSLRPYAYKADLGRYCLLYCYGGWYADITLRPLQGCILPESTQCFFFYDHGQGPYMSMHLCQNGLLYAAKGLKVMEKVILDIVKNCRERFYGATPLYPTGPGLLGYRLTEAMPTPTFRFGHFMQLTPLHAHKSRAYVTSSGEILAFHKSAFLQGNCEGSLEGFGAKGVNNYIEMWRRREIYS